MINNRHLENHVSTWAIVLIQLCRVFESKCCVGILRKNNLKALGLIYRYYSFVLEGKQLFLLEFTFV